MEVEQWWWWCAGAGEMGGGGDIARCKSHTFSNKCSSFQNATQCKLHCFLDTVFVVGDRMAHRVSYIVSWRLHLLLETNWHIE